MGSTLRTGPAGGKSGYGKRLISSRKARRLMAHGWKAADLHVHTRFSYDVIANPGYTSERSSTCPVLSPMRSTGTPNWLSTVR